ncbi:LytTR family transcriptional regulator DNA-binding domain-containing protein [Paenibacillus sp. MMS20-IR301]|uniref:LytTR family transcriptional regulator DNA-binding domain-containing protein n=1 Tax=Paenibacillus sp. MMS20-IR301 TaxID=2895946 RepID=UPI0028E1E585|nr:LytTR family transcriptional regulator DNA-binding domain-containing protein [Paenibacillus sp. MMS20-IR301]WNS45196.1 LytTR family transcriptional regulator DNA-binding domain-containing protein [Paenibacillus sp. MMS20-IR301]
MAGFSIDSEMLGSEALPAFSLTLNDLLVTAVYSDTDLQAELVKALRSKTGIPVLDSEDGLYMRLTVENNIAFFHKWFGCTIPLSEILVQFELQYCVKRPLHKCSESEIRRVCYAKYYMSGVQNMVFCEPIQGVDVRTINSFINMLNIMKHQHSAVLILVSSMEHALILGDNAYKLQPNGIQQIEIIEEGAVPEAEILTPKTVKLFKIPAKVDDKIILFDPPEIDYIEGQDGKAVIVINNEKYAMDSTLAEVEKKLEVYGFYRCHRSYIVNLQKVREIITWSKNTYSLRIDNKVQSTIPLSRTRLQEVLDKFSLE